MARKIIAANWKENPKSVAEANGLFLSSAKAAGKVRNAAIVICPPPLFLEEISRAYRRLRGQAQQDAKGNFANLSLGAQDVFWEEQGPFTGGVGPKMLRSIGVKYVIVGHSERRKWFNETDAMVNKKVLRAAADGLRVILCVGEPLEVRAKGIAAAKRYLKHQLTYDLKKVFGDRPATKGVARGIIVAYEPIWAIGSGSNDDPQDAAEIAAFIKATVRSMAPRTKLQVKVLYGGSVNSRNVADYVQLKDIDGALVGGASLKADEFKKLVTSAAHADSKGTRLTKK